LACESNLIRLGLHKDHASKSPDLSWRQHAGWLEPRHHLREGEPGPRASSPETWVPSSQAPWRAHGGQLTAAASLATAPGSPSLFPAPIPPPGGLALPINASNGSKISTRTAHRLHRTYTRPAPTELAR
jgi:hypothetical protein